MQDGEILYQGVIELPPITKKNSQEIHLNTKTGARWISQSKQYRLYAKNAQFFLHRDEPICESCNVQMIFYMPNRRRVDLSNLQSACLDVLVENRILEDDNAKIIRSHDGSTVLWTDTEHPRTEILITKIPDKKD